MIMGREPAALIGAVTGILAIVVGFTTVITPDQAGAITALLTAVAAAWTAAKVKPVAPTILTGVITTGAALVGSFGLDLSQQQVGTLVGAASLILTAIVVRPQSTPKEDPRPTAVI